jgi:predicted dehydrogenase
MDGDGAPLRIAISGAGAITERAHLPALVATEGVAVVALQSRTREKAARLAEAFFPGGEGPRIYTSFDEMLEREHPDAVGVFAPNRYHCDYTLKAIAAGAHVLVEKPMAPTVAECRAMNDAARHANRVLVVAMQRRYGAFENEIKRALAAGAIGQPHFIRARLAHGGPETWAPGQRWFFDPVEAGGGAMLDLGVHVADLALWWLGEAQSVVGVVGTLSKPIQHEDNGAMIVNFRSGALGVIEASWTSVPGLSAIEIYGSEGRIIAGYPRSDIAIQRADGTDVPGYSRTELLARSDARDMLAPFRALIADFIAAIRGRAMPLPDGTEGARAIELIEACYRSARTGARVSLPLT